MFALPITFVYFLFFNVAATLLMTGIIYFVQFVHYPLLRLISPETMEAYSGRHLFITTFLVIPLMLIETVTAVWLAFDPVFPNLNIYFYWGVALVAAIWTSSLFFQIPALHLLSKEHNRKTISYLIYTNWIRTLAWTARSVLMLYLIYNISQQCMPH